MLSQANIRRINSQIQDELMQAGRSINTDEERQAALERVRVLKGLLDEQASSGPDAKQVADNLFNRLTERSMFQPSLLEELMIRIFNRR